MKRTNKNAGFSLLELLVVIAIMAVLAGVGVAGYSIYTAEADKAADEHLLGEINRVFAAACAEKGILITDLNQNTAVIEVGTEDGVVDFANMLPTDCADSLFFSLGEQTFKVITSIWFNPSSYRFEDNTATGYAYGGGTVYLSPADIAALKESTFGAMGIESLLDKVNDVTGYATAISSEALNMVLDSPEFTDAAMAALGVSTGEELTTTMEQLVAELKIADSTLTEEEAYKQVKANAAVLYAAQSTTKMEASDITTLLGSDGAKSQIMANLESDTGLALSQAAVAYGMYTAYANSTGDTELIEKTENPVAILNGLDDPEFQKYMNSAQGKTDLEGYLAAMNMINSSTGDSNAVKKLMISGFNDPALIALMNQSIGA